MHEPPVESESSPPSHDTASHDTASHDTAWRDTVVVVGITVLSVLVSAHFELNETLYALTRHWEHFQVDEFPFGMLVLSICLIWLSWKRYRHASRELRARRIAEARLGRA